MKIKNTVFAIAFIIFSPVFTNGQTLNQIFDDKDIMNPDISMDNYIAVDKLSAQEKENIKYEFDPFYIDYLYTRKFDNAHSDKIKVNNIGFIKPNEVMNGALISVIFNEDLIKYLNNKFGNYNNTSSFGPVNEVEKNTTYNWENMDYFISLYINKHSSKHVLTNNAVMIIRKKP